MSYGKIVHQVRQWCQYDPTAVVTTLFDVYGLPSDFPGFDNWNAKLSPLPQVVALKASLAADIAQPNLIAYLQLYEYEALLFSDLAAFKYADVPPAAITAWQHELAQCAGPEHINHSPVTAPSKRLIARWPTYAHAKPHYGVLLALEIGLTAIRQQCPRFDQWVSTLESL